MPYRQRGSPTVEEVPHALASRGPQARRYSVGPAPPWRAVRRAATRARPRPPVRPVPGSNARPSTNLLALYQEAVVAEDSDRLQALLAPATARRRPSPLPPRVRTPRAPLPTRPPSRTPCAPPFSRPPSPPWPSRPRPWRLPPTRAASPFWRSKVPSTRRRWRSTRGCIAPPGG